MHRRARGRAISISVNKLFEKCKLDDAVEIQKAKKIEIPRAQIPARDLAVRASRGLFLELIKILFWNISRDKSRGALRTWAK